MIIKTIYSDENYPEGSIESVTGYIPKLSEAICSEDFLSPQVLRTMKDAYVTLTFVTGEGFDKETDCLSFPMFDITDGNFNDIPSAGDYEMDEEGNETLCYGDILINLSAAKKQSEDFGHSFEREVIFLIGHSLLHLFGYDHIEERDAVEMETLEIKILAENGLKNPYEEE